MFKNVLGNLVDGEPNVVERPLLLVAHHVCLVLLGHGYLARDGNAADEMDNM